MDTVRKGVVIMTKYLTKSTSETEALAEKLVHRFKGGTILGLIGELGAGKTCFVRGLAKGLDVDPSSYVSSPTFVILKVYPGRLNLYHFDFYRLSHPEEYENLGFEDYVREDGIVVIEWADRFSDLLPDEMIEIKFSVVGENEREIDVSNIPLP